MVPRKPRLPNKRMQLTKLRAAPERQDKVPPCAPAGGTDGGTASQLIRSVLLLFVGRRSGSQPGCGHGAQVRDRTHMLRRPPTFRRLSPAT